MEHSKSRSLRGLDLINFSLADMRDGIGPFLGIFLLSSQHWNLRDIGIATSLATFAGVIVQTPAGAFVDRYENKKLVVAIEVISGILGYYFGLKAIFTFVLSLLSILFLQWCIAEQYRRRVHCEFILI